MPDEFINTISQQGFHFDFKDSFNVALLQKVLHMGHSVQHLHAHYGHN